jgi:hypothetical protein
MERKHDNGSHTQKPSNCPGSARKEVSPHHKHFGEQFNMAISLIRFNSIYKYLRVEFNSRCPITESARIQNNSSNKTNSRTKQKKKKGKFYQIRSFTFESKFIKISVDLQTALAAQVHLAEE